MDERRDRIEHMEGVGWRLSVHGINDCLAFLDGRSVDSLSLLELDELRRIGHGLVPITSIIDDLQVVERLRRQRETDSARTARQEIGA
jgi:hypothetical protein